MHAFPAREKTRAYLLLLFSYFTVGAMVLTANTAMSHVMAELSLSDSAGVLLVSSLAAGTFLASFVTGFVAEHLGTRRTLRLSAGLLAGGFLLFSLMKSAGWMYVMLLITGLSWGAINNIVNSSVSVMYPGSTSRLNLLHACYSTAAVLFPLLMGWVLTLGGSWRLPVRVVAAMGVLLFALTFMITLPEAFTGKAESAGEGNPFFLKQPRFWLGAAMFFCYVGTEGAASAWLSEWLSRENAFFATVPAETMVALMWLMMTVGRLLFAGIGQRIDRRKMLLGLALGFLLGMLGVVFLSRSTLLSALSVAFMGLSMSATYATIVANNADLVTDGTASGLLYGSGGIGSTTVPFVAGLVSDAAGLRAGMLDLCGVLLVFVLVAWANCRFTKRA